MLRSLALNSLLVSLASSAGLLLGEFAARVVLDPINYLNPTLVGDEYLGHKIEGGSAGHDEWGFRNFARPERAEIVAIGDSMTYGVAAQAAESYPNVLERLSSRTVYSMALGGYGPLQYLHLLRTRAPELHPETVIVGFYFGNDVMDAFNMAHGHERWARYATRQFESAPTPSVATTQSRGGKRFGALRTWLSQNSVLYRVVTSLPLFDSVRESEFRQFSAGAIETTLGDRRMYFSWQEPTVYLNLADERAQEGLAITETAFREMAALSRQSGVRLLVVLFPLKESVYEEYLRSSSGSPGADQLLATVANERVIRLRLISLFDEEGLQYLDLLPVLREANREADAYPVTDSHPNARGYAAVAAAVHQALARPSGP